MTDGWEGIAFDGETYQPELDFARLSSQLQKVRWLLLHPRGMRWTLEQLASLTGGSEAGVSARVRDLRKQKHGSFDVQHERRDSGLWVYWISP